MLVPSILTGRAPERPATSDEITHAIKVSVSAATVGLVFFGITSILTLWVFSSVAPTWALWLWSFMDGALLLTWLAFDLTLIMRPHQVSELVRVWAARAKFILLCADVVVVAMVWLLLPYADQTLMLLIMIFIGSFCPTQILCSPENTEVNRFSIALVHGSVVAFLLSRGGTVESILAFFFLMFGAVLYFVCDDFRRTMRGSVAARLESESVQVKLQHALTAVAQERDSKTQFIATASHDLSQPLQAANLFFDQAMRAPSDHAREQVVQGVRRALSAAEQLLSHMLSHLRLEADAVIPHVSDCDIELCMRRLTHQFQPQATAAHVTLRVAPGHHVLALDPALLDRALGNLLQNAIVHSGASKVLLACRHAGPGRVRVVVIDNGVGVGAIDAKHIFQDFYRGTDSRARMKSGFGLGLASVRRIAKLLKGHAGLDPRWLHGAAFYLEFSVSEQGNVQSY